MQTSNYDPLSEFHLHQTDEKTYALIAHIIAMLEQEKSNLDLLYRNLSNILGETEATSILKLICRNKHIDYLNFMEKAQVSYLRHFSPRLILHMLCLPGNYVAVRLQIDHDTAAKLLAELRNEFTIDDPIVWLKQVLSQAEKESLRYQHAKDDLLHGLNVVNQPTDTAEERKIKQRKLKPSLRPPYEKG